MAESVHPAASRTTAEPQPSFPAKRGAGMRWVVLGVLAIVLLLAGGALSAYWFYAIETFRAEVLAWIDRQRAEGTTITYRDITRAGFPNNLRLSFREPAIASAVGSWSAGEVSIKTPAFEPGLLQVRVSGSQKFRLPAALGGGSYAADAARFVAEILPVRSWLPNGTLTVKSLTATGGRVGERLTVASLVVTSQGDPATASAEVPYRLTLTANDLALPDTLPLPSGGRIDLLSIEGDLVGALNRQPWPRNLFRWRDEGGILNITQLRVIREPIRIEGDGTIALDQRGQPMAAFGVKLSGAKQIVDQLSSEQRIRADTERMVRIVLGLMSQAGADGKPIVTVPVTVQDSELYVGPLPVARLPEVDWQAGGRTPR